MSIELDRAAELALAMAELEKSWAAYWRVRKERCHSVFDSEIDLAKAFGPMSPECALAISEIIRRRIFVLDSNLRRGLAFRLNLVSPDEFVHELIEEYHEPDSHGEVLTSNVCRRG